MTNKISPISCVVIGLNCEKTLRDCLVSVNESATLKPLEIIYVDGGSKDNSVMIAKSIQDVQVIELHLTKPTPGRGRNAGWQASRGEWVQFLDSDTILDKDWLSQAQHSMTEYIAAIYGWRREKYPLRNFFHFITDLEWLRPQENACYFGGDVLIRRNVLEVTQGYDESLVGGEDPELAVRVRALGWKIQGIDAKMCMHDIDMNNLKAYFKRAYRTGYAYAEAGLKMKQYIDTGWFNETLRISSRASLVILFIILFIIIKSWYLLLGTAILLLLPIRKTGYFQKYFQVSFKEGFLYSLHCCLVVWPEFWGIIIFFLNKLSGK